MGQILLYSIVNLIRQQSPAAASKKRKKGFSGAPRTPAKGWPPFAIPLALGMLVPGTTGVWFSVTVVVMVMMMTVVTAFGNG